MLSKIKWWLILAAVLLIAAGFVLSLIAKPGNPLYRLKKTREAVLGKFASFSVVGKANYDLSLAQQRVNEFSSLKTETDRLTSSELVALSETQAALKRIDSALKTVRIRFMAYNSKIKPQEVEGLLNKFSETLKRQLDTLNQRKQSLSGSEELKKLSSFKNELTALQEKVESLKADLADDQRINDSLASPRISTTGVIKIQDNSFKLVVNATTLAVKSTQYNLKDYQDKLVKIEGTLTQKGALVLESLESQLITPGTSPIKIRATGIVDEKGGPFTLTNKNQPDFVLEGAEITLAQYLDKLVEVRGELEKDKIRVTHLKLKL